MVENYNTSVSVRKRGGSLPSLTDECLGRNCNLLCICSSPIKTLLSSVHRCLIGDAGCQAGTGATIVSRQSEDMVPVAFSYLPFSGLSAWWCLPERHAWTREEFRADLTTKTKLRPFAQV